jgi:hypothetical protein
MRAFLWQGPRRASTVWGIRVDLPFEQEVNPFVAETFEHRTFFSRLHHFVLLSEAGGLCRGAGRHRDSLGVGNDLAASSGSQNFTKFP